MLLFFFSHIQSSSMYPSIKSIFSFNATGIHKLKKTDYYKIVYIYSTVEVQDGVNFTKNQFDTNVCNNLPSQHFNKL